MCCLYFFFTLEGLSHRIELYYELIPHTRAHSMIFDQFNGPLILHSIECHFWAVFVRSTEPPCLVFVDVEADDFAFCRSHDLNVSING